MAIRTTDAAVQGIIEVDSSILLDPFIETASSLVDDVAAATNAPGTSRLELIERYLSAHFYTLRDPRPVSERAGPVSNTFQSKVDTGLMTSHYGQMAISLDPTGVLKNASKGKRAGGVVWVGNEADRGLAEGT
jgi:hypothetical protein